MELSSTEIQTRVTFDADSVVVTGRYIDELAAYRARRGWKEALSLVFLLEDDVDFTTDVVNDGEAFALHCVFHSACAKYAFWRLTHDQAPEAQYLIETAHIPCGESTAEQLMTAPELEPSHGVREATAIVQKVRDLLARLI